MPPTGAPDDLAYATALAAACQRILAAPDAAALWRTVVDEALALIAADGVAVVSYIEGFWQTLAVRTSDSASGDSAAAEVIEMLFRQGPLQQPFPNDDPAEVAAWDALGERAVLVARIEGSPRQPLRLVWYATGPASLSPYAEIAEAIRPSRQPGPESRYGTGQLDPSDGRTASSGTGARDLDDSPSAYGRPSVRSAETRVAEHPREATNNRSNGHPDRRSAVGAESEVG